MRGRWPPVTVHALAAVADEFAAVGMRAAAADAAAQAQRCQA